MANVKIKRNLGAITAKINAGAQSMKIAVTESVIEYGNIFVREDQGTLKDSALTSSQPQKGLLSGILTMLKKFTTQGAPQKT